MAERPLLILPAPGAPADRRKKFGRAGDIRLPKRERQGERLDVRFTAVQQAFDAQRARLQADAAGLLPEQVIVLETVGTVEDFIVAVRNVEGMEWLGEIEEDAIPADDDFFVADKKSHERTDKSIRGRLFLVMGNHRALEQLRSMWAEWKAGHRFRRGLAKWEILFAQLRDVRPWGVQDRLLETGVLDDWRERVEHADEVVPCEIELWYRSTEAQRAAAAARIDALVEALEGEVVGQAVVAEIAYHAKLVNLPVAAVTQFLEATGRDAEFIQCEQIQFLRACGQMAGIVVEDERSADEGLLADAATARKAPVIALFDGLPLQNHRRLAGRLVVDDPDGFEAEYPARDRVHGTAMASLIVHGDLGAGDAPLTRQLYVRPILQPDPRDWHQPRYERVPESVLVVDLVHRAVRRLFEGQGQEPASAPEVCVVNLSIGIRDRPFQSAMTPLARLLDWLSWEYRVLFVVSAGNHDGPIRIGVPRDQVAGLSAEALQDSVLRAVAEDSRHRRLLSPAEAMNALTVGATHSDASDGMAIAGAIMPYSTSDLPSVINAQGMGYRRAIKPDVLAPGGRVVLQEGLNQDAPGTSTSFDVYRQSRPPGQSVAAPGPNPGDLSYSCHTRGTSNAAALLSRAASQLYDVVEQLVADPGGELIDHVPRALWMKALLAHGAAWSGPGDVLTRVLRTPNNGRQFREYLTRLLGYGVVDTKRVAECSTTRVTAIGAGVLQAEQSHIHRFPLPPSLSGKHGLRRLTVTLAWLTPVNPSHQGWRRADLWFTPPLKPLGVERQEADSRAVQRGTLQHEVLEGTRAAAFVDGDQLELQVSCRSGAGTLENPVPYALAITLEVADAIGIDIYEEVRTRVHAARIAVAPGN